MKKALTYAVLASMFFACTFILNRSMNLGGGYWMWGASLRYLVSLPLLCMVLAARRKNKVKEVIEDVRRQPKVWTLWGTVGFGLFYLPLCLASVYGESWMTASAWQITIVAGILLSPMTGKKIPFCNVLMGFVILAGVFVMEIPDFNGSRGNLIALIPILIGTFAYPMGNRKMMQHCPQHLDTMQRILGMTIGSYPFWIIVSITAFFCDGAPGIAQLLKAAMVAVFSGIIATSLFFHATDLVKDNARYLALVEAAQCGEVIFTLLGGVLILGDAMPDIYGWIGMILIVLGMICNSILSAEKH